MTGGRVFGYDNLDVDRHVERVINQDEATVVRRIFDLCVSGVGFARITKTPNAERAIAPRPQQARPAGWSPSTVRDILHRELYRGVIVWNRSRKRDLTGDVAPSPRPESDWLRIDAPQLRIVTDEQWTAAHRRLGGIPMKLETAQGARPIVRRDVESPYVLSGFARCGQCGGTPQSRKQAGLLLRLLCPSEARA